MDTFRKWLNKPKADDKSLLARFYHADRSLTEVATELDSFDGRAEPDRCSRLVSRLRQNQDKVLAITNMIMEELLGEDRDPRTFRAKFPEEVLQENLAGQLWFGAECLAAGSSIMNRETESKEMRPLAQAVTKSLGNVRILLRDQCLRNNVPNSKTLQLDLNDISTEQLYESLKIFDRLFAEFELSYVSAMVQVKSKHEYEMQQWITVLFSESLRRALKIGLLDQDKVDAFDPALMFSIPRLAIVAGLVIFAKGPLNMDMPSDDLSEMFRPFRTILMKIRDLLCNLSKPEMFQLEQLLCTNEDIITKIPAGKSSVEAPNNDHISTSTSNIAQNTKIATHNPDEVVENYTDQRNNNLSATVSQDTTQLSESTQKKYFSSRNASILFVSAESLETTSPTASPIRSNSVASTSSLPSSSTSQPADWSDGDEGEADIDVRYSDEVNDTEIDIVSPDCASGYLIPNTNFGNLFQSQEVPLIDNFIGNEDEFGNCLQQQQQLVDLQSDVPSTSAALQDKNQYNDPQNEELTMKSTNFDMPSTNKNNEQQTHQHSIKDISTSSSSNGSLHQRELERSNNITPIEDRHNQAKFHRYRNQNRRRSRNCQYYARASEDCRLNDCDCRSTENCNGNENNSSIDSNTPSLLSDGDQNGSFIVRNTSARLKFTSTENLLHRLFVCIAGVADQLQTNFASDLRQILRSVFYMNITPSKDEIDIPEKTKESELFEFRASENDVIQGSAGSNQSIYSAEEVNPESDNVFNVCNDSSVSLNREANTASQHSASAAMHRNNTIDLINGTEVIVTHNHVIRSRSMGDQATNEITADVYLPHQRDHDQQQIRYRNNSVGSNTASTNSSTSSTNSSEQNSPVSARVSETHNRNNNAGSLAPATSHTLAPPKWIPDEKAPRCMSCQTPFTAFRRRHHCRNCGGVFCGVCSKTSAPLPKYGLTKAVRVCRDCFVSEVCVVENNLHPRHVHAQTANGSS